MLRLTPTRAIRCNTNTPEIRVEQGWDHERRHLHISETVQDRTKVTMAD